MSYFYSFVTKKLERSVKDYIKSNKGQEIFLGVMGRVKAKRSQIALFIYEIVDIIAFPNISQNPEYQAMVTDSWYDIVSENIQFRQNFTLTPLGILHSHVLGGKTASELDFEFMKRLSKKLNRLIMIIIYYSPEGRFYEKAYVLVKNGETEIVQCHPFSK